MSFSRHFSNAFIYALVVLVVGVVWYLADQGSIGQKEVGSAFLSMIGTFSGALFAFRLNERKQKTDRDQLRKNALNRALFILLRQYNALVVIKKHIDLYKSEFERAFNCPAIKPPEYGDLKQDFGELAFLIDIAEPNLLMKLSIEDEAFHQALESLRLRNNFYVNEVQSAISKAGFNRRRVPWPEFQTVLGEQLCERATNEALVFFSHIEASVRSLAEIHQQLFEASKSLYPNESFLKLAQAPKLMGEPFSCSV